MKRLLGLTLALVLLTCLFAAPGLANGQEVTIYLVRHGRTLFNTIGKVQGYVDSPLTDEGIAGAQDTGMGLAGVAFDAAFSSDRGRAVETAEIILALNQAADTPPIRQLKDLREMNYGKYEGTSTNIWQVGCEALGATFPEGMGQFPMNDIVDAIAASDETGACETYDETLARLMRGLDQVATSVAGGNVLCVAHGGAISNIATALGATVTGELPNSSVTVVKYKDGTYALGAVGDMAYSEAGAAARAANGGQVQYPQGKAPASHIPQAGPGKVHIYLVRHGKTLLNAAGRMQGISDAPLTPEGVQGAINTGLGLKDVRFDAVYSSDLGRTIETVDLMLSMNAATSPDVPRTKLKDLREYSFGIYEADSQAEVFPLLMQAAGITDLSQLGEKGIPFLGMYDLLANDDNLMEKNAPFAQRVNRGLDLIAAQMSGQAGETNALVCVHGLVMGSLMDRFGISVNAEIPNAAVIEMIYENGQYQLVKDDQGEYQNLRYQVDGARLNPYVEGAAPAQVQSVDAMVNGQSVAAVEADGVLCYPAGQLARAAGGAYSLDGEGNAIVIAGGKRLSLGIGTNMYYVDTRVLFADTPFFATEEEGAYAPAALVLGALGIPYEEGTGAVTVK